MACVFARNERGGPALSARTAREAPQPLTLIVGRPEPRTDVRGSFVLGAVYDPQPRAPVRERKTWARRFGPSLTLLLRVAPFRFALSEFKVAAGETRHEDAFVCCSLRDRFAGVLCSDPSGLGGALVVVLAECRLLQSRHLHQRRRF